MAERMTPEQWDRLVAGWEPTEVDLLRAPRLDDWYPRMHRGVLVVVGRVWRHPRAVNGTAMQTSQVLRVADDGSWLRTRREYYRLGRPYELRMVQDIAEEVLPPERAIRPLPWTEDMGDGREECPDLPAAQP